MPLLCITMLGVSTLTQPSSAGRHRLHCLQTRELILRKPGDTPKTTQPESTYFWLHSLYSTPDHRGGHQADRQSEACSKPENGELGTNFTASDTPPHPYGSPRAAAGPAKGQRLFPYQARRLHSPRCAAGHSASRGLGLGNKPTPPDTIQKLHSLSSFITLATPQGLSHCHWPLGYQTRPRRHRPFLSWQDVLPGGCSRPQLALS